MTPVDGRGAPDHDVLMISDLSLLYGIKSKITTNALGPEPEGIFAIEILDPIRIRRQDGSLVAALFQ
jgi:hypothetical protein